MRFRFLFLCIVFFTPSCSSAEGPFSLPALPYAYNALEPYFDEQTMQIHHSKHHATYVAGLNAAVKGTDVTGDAVGLTTFQAGALAKGSAGRNHGGGHYNHAFFWVNLAPPSKTGAPSKELEAAIVAAFGSVSGLQGEFAKVAMGRFGSGWAWLGVANGKLVVTSTANQDNPLMEGLEYDYVKMIPILGLDVWEHAYYLKYQNKRPDYVEAFWQVVNWNKVNRNYEVYAKVGKPVPPTPTGGGHASDLGYSTQPMATQSAAEL
jgi:Fe-Mn family superoxide dismutase